MGDSMDAPSIGSVNSTETPGRKKFGEISRIVAERWRGMSDADKQAYAERAKKVNEDKEKEEARREAERIRYEEEKKRNPPPPVASPGPIQNGGGPASPVGRVRNDSGPATPRAEPLFHAVPPRPQRLLHSEAYIKYIEGLNKDSRSMCNWDRQLNANSEAMRVPDEGKLPVSWLAGNQGEYATSTEALWALRDFMLQEALGVVKITAL